MREDFKDGVLTEQDYAMLKSDYDKEKGKLQLSLDELTTERTKLKKTLSQENKWLAEFQRFEAEQQLSAGIVATLIEKIKVYDGGRIEVFLRYRDEFERLQKYIGEFSEEVRVDDEEGL